MTDKDPYSRQEALGVPTSAFIRRVHVVGAGGIGSPLVLALAKTGFQPIHVWDGDEVEDGNTACQLYGWVDVLSNKARAIANVIEGLMPVIVVGEDIIVPHETFVMEDDEAPFDDAEILCLAVDSNRVRFDCLRHALKARENDKGPRFLVDGRLDGFIYTVYNVDLDDEKQVEEYMGMLEPDPPRPVCVQPATFYMGQICAGRMAGEVLKDALIMYGVEGVEPKFNIWENTFGNIIATEQELFR